MIEFPSDTISCILFATPEHSVSFCCCQPLFRYLETRKFFKEYNLARVKKSDVLLLLSINAESGLQPSYFNAILIVLQFCPFVLSLSMLIC